MKRRRSEYTYRSQVEWRRGGGLGGAERGRGEKGSRRGREKEIKKGGEEKEERRRRGREKRR